MIWDIGNADAADGRRHGSDPSQKEERNVVSRRLSRKATFAKKLELRPTKSARPSLQTPRGSGHRPRTRTMHEAAMGLSGTAHSASPTTARASPSLALAHDGRGRSRTHLLGDTKSRKKAKEAARRRVAKRGTFVKFRRALGEGRVCDTPSLAK